MDERRARNEGGKPDASTGDAEGRTERGRCKI
jgi:hypothetical protein